MKYRLFLLSLNCLLLSPISSFTVRRAASPLSSRQSTFRKPSAPQLCTSTSNNEDQEPSGPWNPALRKVMTGVASFGAVETAYLTATKLGGDNVLCAVDGSCQDVLNSPYATVPFTDNVPLAAVGCFAYTFTAVLAVAPMLVKDDDDINNRMVLLIVTTAMGTFSTFLMSLLYGVLHQSCLYCLSSACLSWTLCASAWLGGVLPPARPHRELALQGTTAGVVSTMIAAIVLFASADAGDSSFSTAANAADSTSTAMMSPPAITTTSSPQAIALAKELSMLNAKMYGAFWCSHCYDQKQALGKSAFYAGVQYIECSKDGVDSQAALCKERDVPGYPTWEIGGKLYPGEQELDELQEIVDQAKKAK